MKDWQPFVRLLEKKFSTLQETTEMIEEMRRLLKVESDEKRVDAIMEMVSKLLSEHPYAEANRRLCSLFIKNMLVLQLESELYEETEKKEALDELYNELEERFKWELSEETLLEMLKTFTSGEEKREPGGPTA